MQRTTTLAAVAVLLAVLLLAGCGRSVPGDAVAVANTFDPCLADDQALAAAGLSPRSREILDMSADIDVTGCQWRTQIDKGRFALMLWPSLSTSEAVDNLEGGDTGLELSNATMADRHVMAGELDSGSIAACTAIFYSDQGLIGSTWEEKKTGYSRIKPCDELESVLDALDESLPTSI